MRVFSARCVCLAGLITDASIAADAAQLATGGWLDLQHTAHEEPLDMEGRPNALTRDVGTLSSRMVLLRIRVS